MESIGIVLNTIAANMRTEGLLRQSQLLTSELQSQQEELKKTNDTLEMQAASLRKSEEMLKSQQEELRKTNEELEDKAQLLSNEKKQVEEKNREVELAKAALEEKAEQLALTSRYKSEFLANMSHELRTPLNSLLMLSKLLSDNTEGNLTEMQIKFARTIHAGGSELLSLINDILDLSKIESGTVTLDIGEVDFGELRDQMERTFGQVAHGKSLGYSIEIDPTLPNRMRTDEKRLQQIMKNLLSNAFKFTESGEVTFKVERARRGWSFDHPVLATVDQVVAFSVTDTGIGIPEDKQKIIFEAFQQADGTTNRKYGGTGLGLSISRELARLLGGEITIKSAAGQGSTFTLYLPLDFITRARVVAPAVAKADPAEPQQLTVPAKESLVLLERTEIADDRHDIHVGDQVLLIIEDRDDVASMALAAAREAGFKGLISTVEYAVPLIRRTRPHAIMIGIGTNDMDAWALLDLLKHDVHTRHVPVQIVSAERHRRRALSMGAYGFTPAIPDSETLLTAFAKLRNFVERDERKLLVYCADDARRADIVTLLADDTVDTTAVATTLDALDAFSAEDFDCLVVDIAANDSSGIELIERIRSTQGFSDLAIVAYTESDIAAAADASLKGLGVISAFRRARSADRLLDETALYLHRAVEGLPVEKSRVLRQLPQKDPSLAGKKIVVIDDDFRNIFALTSALEQHDMEVLYAETGRNGIELLKCTPGVDLALIDVMMPEMDGYETMREIRKIPNLALLPLIAVTAKAMKGDREKCIEAGASDYLAKPVEIDQLLSMLRVWLYK
jgi:signal transduction histidine kinase/DNA-binding response OmpR family regulator